MSTTASSNRAFFNQLRKYYTWYTGGFIAFLIALAILEQMGLPKVWIGYVFLFATIGLYAGIGIMSRPADVAEYYVAGRRVPALFNVRPVMQVFPLAWVFFLLFILASTFTLLNLFIAVIVNAIQQEHGGEARPSADQELAQLRLEIAALRNDLRTDRAPLSGARRRG